jgi:8-hydroxy-5-deazaflavin:NADPH oxidoreductase
VKIGTIGAGSVAGTLGRAWAAKGHDVVFGVRDPRGPKVQELVKATAGKARAASPAEAAAHGEVVLLATPWAAARAALRGAGDLSGKVLVDATNPLAPDLSGLALGHTTSAGEEVARWAPGARVVKAFNTIGAQHMANPRFGGQSASMLVCGDDLVAKKTVLGLAEVLGFDPVDAGPLRQARLLEPLAMLWISLAYAYGHGPDIAFKLLRR